MQYVIFLIFFVRLVVYAFAPQGSNALLRGKRFKTTNLKKYEYTSRSYKTKRSQTLACPMLKQLVMYY